MHCPPTGVSVSVWFGSIPGSSSPSAGGSTVSFSSTCFFPRLRKPEGLQSWCGVKKTGNLSGPLFLAVLAGVAFFLTCTCRRFSRLVLVSCWRATRTRAETSSRRAAVHVRAPARYNFALGRPICASDPCFGCIVARIIFCTFASGRCVWHCACIRTSSLLFEGVVFGTPPQRGVLLYDDEVSAPGAFQWMQ